MSKIMLDEGLRAKLNGLNASMEVCDEKGETLGRFLPEETYRTLLYAWLKSQVSDEELDALRKETGGRSLTEIWKSLGRV